MFTLFFPSCRPTLISLPYRSMRNDYFELLTLCCDVLQRNDEIDYFELSAELPGACGSL